MGTTCPQRAPAVKQGSLRSEKSERSLVSDPIGSSLLCSASRRRQRRGIARKKALQKQAFFGLCVLDRYGYAVPRALWPSIKLARHALSGGLVQQVSDFLH